MKQVVQTLYFAIRQMGKPLGNKGLLVPAGWPLKPHLLPFSLSFLFMESASTTQRNLTFQLVTPALKSFTK